MNATHLWSRYLAAREDPDAGLTDARLRRLRILRDRLVAHYAPLAATAARRAAPKPPPPLDADDVVSWGMGGLLDAVETFEPDRGARFETHAFNKVRWRVLDEVRKADPLPRSARSRARAAEAARASLRQTLGRAPTEEEVAAALGTQPRLLRNLARRELASVRPASLDAPVFPSADTATGAGLHALLADPTDDPQEALDRSEERERVAGALDALDERSRLVVTAYFYRGMKLREIGAELGLTEGRISQILRAALDALREDLASGLPRPQARCRAAQPAAPVRPDAA
ncbi:sigma-70 family RNA polymerase sigma factor [Rubrobacter tropicus]|uniref:Sigma-70 family RNA polymerase sigma factor n=1 Tax=Rubrobacter tropicus TaxID=2653851 RepID=A0A6G8QDM5_9ACTN|nr:sigma-70 family RNA polymerase sigma factor [Rubrobacter tropicus]QIN84604.1 sigma-70 family RNA polymerase sigma factor [Rubrobacter tropicus]